MLPCVLLETEKVKKALENGAGPVAFTDAGNILGVGAPLEHAVPQFETPVVVVGSVQNALLPFGSRFSRTCPQTVLACLHAYGSPLIT